MPQPEHIPLICYVNSPEEAKIAIDYARDVHKCSWSYGKRFSYDHLDATAFLLYPWEYDLTYTDTNNYKHYSALDITSKVFASVYGTSKAL